MKMSVINDLHPQTPLQNLELMATYFLHFDATGRTYETFTVPQGKKVYLVCAVQADEGKAAIQDLKSLKTYVIPNGQTILETNIQAGDTVSLAFLARTNSNISLVNVEVISPRSECLRVDLANEPASMAVDPSIAQPIIEELRAKAASILAAALGEKPLEPFVTGTLGNFPYYWQSPRNLEFNVKTYNWISSALKATPTSTSQPLSSLAAYDVKHEQLDLLIAWKRLYHHFPDGDGEPIDLVVNAIASQWASPPTDLTQMKNAPYLQELLNTAPDNGELIVHLLARYLHALGSSATDSPALAMTNNTPRQLDQSFNSIYIDVFSKVSYSLSSNDRAKLTKAYQDAANQQFALLNAWKQAYGSFPDGTGQPIDNILGKIATEWSNPATDVAQMGEAMNLIELLNKTPASGRPIIPLLAEYLDATESVHSLENASAMNNNYLRRALKAVQTPDANNGGLQTDDNVYRPDYQVAIQLADILDGLKATSNAISLKMSVSRYSESEFRVSIAGGASINIPVLALFTLSVDAETSYFSDHIATSSNTTDIELTYTGVTLVNYGPGAYDQSNPNQYWFWTKPITDAINNADHDVSGFKFSPKPQVDFTESGPFGYVTGVAISNYPSVKITVKSSDYESIEKTFEKTVKVGLTFLGVTLGIEGSESTYSHNLSVDSSSQTVTITLDPPQQLTPGGNLADSVGWVLGVQTEYPAA